MFFFFLKRQHFPFFEQNWPTDYNQNKEETVHRYAVRGEKREWKMLLKLWYSVRDPSITQVGSQEGCLVYHHTEVNDL